MDKREALKSMLNSIINDKPEEASLDLHNYLTAKMREVAGFDLPNVNGSKDELEEVDNTDGDGDTADLDA